MFKRRNICDKVVSVSIVLIMTAFMFVFASRAEIEIPPSGYEYRVLEKYVTMGTIYDRAGEYIAMGIDNDTEKFNSEYEVSFSNLIGDSIEKTYADAYTVRGKYARVLYGAKENNLTKINPFSQRVGGNVYLTIDGKTQNYVYQVLKQYESASALVINWKTGEIIAAPSIPAYNLSFDSEKLKQDENGLVISDKAYNKNFKGSQSIGSVVKCIVDACILDIDNRFKDYHYDCKPGTHTFNEIKVDCYGGTYHGNLGMKDALTVSCNGYQLALINQVDEEELSAKLQKFGFDTTTTLAGNLSFYDARYLGNKNEVTRDNKTLAGIGQGNAKASPVAISYAYAALFNGGKSVPVHIVSSTSLHNGEKEMEEKSVSVELCSEESADTIIEYMKNVTHNGTGKVIKGLKYECASKTGTAEINDQYNSLWFVGGSIEEEAPYMTVVCLQYCTKDMKASEDAGSIAQKILEYVFEHVEEY